MHNFGNEFQKMRKNSYNLKNKMNTEITDYFRHIIEQYGSYDIARAEFFHHIDDDPALHEQYAEWCEENGYSERNGFDEFIEQHINSADSVWDSLNDFDE